MTGMRLYTLASREYEPLAQRWLQGTLKDPWQLQQISAARAQGVGHQPTDRLWLRHLRTEKILETVRQNTGQIIVWADPDVQFFGRCQEQIELALRDWEMAFISTSGEGNISPAFEPYVDIGFMALRCTPRVLRFWERVLEEQVTLEPVSELYPTEMIVNRLLMDEPEVSWGVLDHRFWCTGQLLPPPADLLVHHARTGDKPIGEQESLQRLLETKSRLLEHVRNRAQRAPEPLHWRILVLGGEEGEWLGRCLRSIQQQQSDFSCHVLLDAPDGATQAQLGHLAGDRRFHPAVWGERTGPLGMLLEHLRQAPPRDNELLLILEGGDQLVDGRVLRKLEAVYQEPDVWITYGNYMESYGEGEPQFLRDGLIWDYRATWEQRQTMEPEWLVAATVRPWSDQVIAASSYRQERGWNVGYPWSLRGQLWKQLPLEQLLSTSGQPYQAAWQMALLYPLLELSGEHALCIRDRLVIHNGRKPVRENPTLYLQEAEEIRSLPAAMQPALSK
jgi:hypothetical protein